MITEGDTAYVRVPVMVDSALGDVWIVTPQSPWDDESEWPGEYQFYVKKEWVEDE